MQEELFEQFINSYVLEFRDVWGEEKGTRSTEVDTVTSLPCYRMTSLPRYVFPLLPLYRISSLPPYFSSSPPLYLTTPLPRYPVVSFLITSLLPCLATFVHLRIRTYLFTSLPS